MEKQLKNGYYKKFIVKDLSGFKGSGDKNNFFTPAEEGRLLHSILQSVVYESVRLLCGVCVVLQYVTNFDVCLSNIAVVL